MAHNGSLTKGLREVKKKMEIKIADIEPIDKEKFEAPAIPANWDFKSADKEFDSHIRKWRRLTADVISELWIFYNKLKVQGRRSDLVENSIKLPTWHEWLESKGISVKTPLNHFKALGWLPSDSLVSRFTANAENYTPAPIIQKVRDVLGEIDLDPASCDYAQKVVKAKKYYTEKDDGLKKPWSGKVFLNPPYGMPLIREFTDKLINELPNIEEAILLTNDQTDTNWWQKCAINSKVVCLPSGRLHFYTPEEEETSPTNGQTFFYYGKNEKDFCEKFSTIGIVVKVIKKRTSTNRRLSKNNTLSNNI